MEYLLAVGGSAVSGCSTPASDLDLFLLAPSGADERAILEPFSEFFPRYDLEVRTHDWLSQLDPMLRRYVPAISAGLSPFSWIDLRFLARIVRGRRLAGSKKLAEKVGALEEPLRLALAAYVGSLYVLRYQDVYGLVAAKQSAYSLVMAGELMQHACLLAALQLRLIDPSPKWAPRLAENIGSDEIRWRVRNLLRHLAQDSQGEHYEWTVSLLNFANGIVAAAMLEVGYRDHDFEFANGGQMSDEIARQFADPRFCAMGVPGYLTMVDCISNEILLGNKPFFSAMASYSKQDASRTES